MSALPLGARFPMITVVQNGFAFARSSQEGAHGYATTKRLTQKLAEIHTVRNLVPVDRSGSLLDAPRTAPHSERRRLERHSPHSRRQATRDHRVLRSFDLQDPPRSQETSELSRPYDRSVLAARVPIGRAHHCQPSAPGPRSCAHRGRQHCPDVPRRRAQCRQGGRQRSRDRRQ